MLEQPVVVLFMIIGSGLLLGRIRISGISLGTSGIIFSSLILGAMGADLPKALGSLGLVLFVYCVGLGAGPGFFQAFVRQGSRLAQLAIFLTVVGAATATVLAKALHVPVDLAAGIFAGALTSTPALAAATQNLPPDSVVTIGYGLAYPFGVVSVVLFVQLLPRLLGRDLNVEAGLIESSTVNQREIRRALVEVMNPAVFGRRVADIHFLAHARGQISRILQGEQLVPFDGEAPLEQGQQILVIGDNENLPDIVEFLGRPSDLPYTMDTDSQRRRVVVTSKEMVGRTLAQLALPNRFGVIVTRVLRYDVSFVPSLDTRIQKADLLHVVGQTARLKKFTEFAGHRMRLLDETDLISLSIGILLGIGLGSLPLPIPGGARISLGLAGGPLLTALCLSHFGGIGKLKGHLPRPARLVLTEIGLSLFLAQAGVLAGGRFLGVLQEFGPSLFAMAAAVAIVPMATGYVFASKVLKLDLLQLLGGICGSMTSTPGMGAITEKTDSDIPAVTYAASYPVALIIVTVATQLMVMLLSQ